MLTQFFYALRAAKLPVSIKEHLALLDALDQNVIGPGNPDACSMEDFYFLSRAILVKDEKHYDKFDKAFGAYFKGVDAIADFSKPIPSDWLRKEIEKLLTDSQKEKAPKLDYDELMDTLKKRLEEQKERHEGGSKWVGTGGTSPFGNGGYNTQGIRIGGKGGNKSAVKVWEKRAYRDYDDTQELGTRNIKVALRRLRKFARQGLEEELDLDGTIRNTAANAGYLDIKLVPERHNHVKVLLLMDVGGTMDEHIERVEELFSAARAEFKHLEHFYFHNCLYEGIWRDNARRWNAQTPTWEVLRTYGPDYKCIFVGDASMSPYEIAYAGGANEHWNPIAGEDWLRRAREQWPNSVWLNPVPEKYWPYTQSIGMIQRILDNRMAPMTLDGISSGMKLIT